VIFCVISVAASGAWGQPPTNLADQQRTQAIADLDSARARENEALGEGRLSPAETANSLSQAPAAGRFERESKGGLEVSREEIADALAVPQSKISPQQRASLIERVNRAKEADEYKLNNVNGDSYGHDLLRAQTSLAGRTIDELKAGKDVPWSQISKALEAPKDR
jgi:hypothetical protein